MTEAERVQLEYLLKQTERLLEAIGKSNPQSQRLPILVKDVDRLRRELREASPNG